MSDGTGDRLEGKADELKGNVKQGVGDATDNRSMQSEGMVDEAKGKGKGALGTAKDAISDAADSLRKKTN